MSLNFSKEIIQTNGVVYTPKNLAIFVANKLIRYYFESEGFYMSDSINSDKFQRVLSDLKILDPACGEGELLIASWLALSSLLNQSQIETNNNNISPQNALYGLDIDSEALNVARERIKESLGLNCNINKLKFIKTNALFPLNGKKRKAGWDFLYNKYDIKKGFDLIIANPPWGADTSKYQDQFKSNEFVLHKGQYDTSDLFIELALHITKKNGLFAFIISDSLFNEERTDLRQMLLEKTEVKFVGRFGEKIFKNINRACAVIICKKCSPNHNHKVDCLRLTHKIRKDIIEGSLSFSDADKLFSHKVKQSRFLNNPNFIYDIDLKETEESVLEKFNKTLRFGDFLSSSRGIELSKHGKVSQCPQCKLWFPFPRSKSPKCPHCNIALMQNDLEHKLIIKDTKVNGYKPLLVFGDTNYCPING